MKPTAGAWAGLALAAILAGGLGGLAGAGAPARRSVASPYGMAAGAIRYFAPAPQPAPPPLAAPPAPSPVAGRPALAPPSADHRVDRPPSISAARIDQVLTAYGSPAAGQGAVFYDLGRQYGIDPAYAVAFYIHESQAGTRGVARTSRSLGNIRCTPGWPRCVEGYRAYDSMAQAVEDWYQLIKGLYIGEWGLRTPATILPKYAPQSENDTAAYTASVTGLVDSWQP